jgi:glycosyltransferase involved in cell wall biosynthesis
MDDLGSEVMRGEGRSSLEVGLVHFCEKLAVRYANGVTVVSTFLQRQTQKAHPLKPILLMSNGVNTAQYPMAAIAKPRPVIYYFGMVNRLSLVEDLLRAAPEIIKAVPGAEIKILGGGFALPDAKKLVEELGVAKHVTFSGQIAAHDIVNYVQFADIAVCYQPDIPTVRAASNLKVFQYMSLGSVPVVSDVGDLKTYVANGNAGVAVAAGNTQALSAALIDLLQNNAKRTALATAAHKHVTAEYEWSKLAARFERFMQATTKRGAA